jgi:NADPH:quinone reductase-like Zn-dependent oxidoreductase
MSSAQRFVPYGFARDNAILLKPAGEHDAEAWISDSTPLAALNEVMRVFPGQVRPVVTAEFALCDAAAAHRLSQTGRARGKIVLYAGTP